MDMRIITLDIEILLESNPLKFRILVLVRRLAVSVAGARARHFSLSCSVRAPLRHVRMPQCMHAIVDGGVDAWMDGCVTHRWKDVQMDAHNMDAHVYAIVYVCLYVVCAHACKHPRAIS